jgi:formylglycine-generating enzyme required for sulfatase activity
VPLKLFISYSHQDQAQLDKLLEGLRPMEREGLIEPWTDRLIDVGEDWREKIGAALNDCDLGLFLLSIPFLASDFIHAEELKPLLLREQSGGVRLFPILLRACDWKNSPLGHLQPLPGWDEYIEKKGDDQPSRDEAWTRVVTIIRQWVTDYADKKDGVSWEGSPYPGLRAFDEREAPIFTGREEKTAALVNKLDRGVRFLAVYGASGSGKSSLVRAGLIPEWRKRFPAVKNLPVLIIKPDEDADGNPFTPLGTALHPLMAPGSDRAGLRRALSDDPRSIGKYIDTALRGLPDSAELLLVVDQFEELFTTVEAPHRERFRELLGHFLMHPRARVVLTVRSDFFHRLDAFPELTDRLNEENGHFLVTPLGPEHYRTLIEKPGRLAGFRFEEGLVDRMLAEAEQGGSREGVVPLLQFALAKLYQPFAERPAREKLPPDRRYFSTEDYQAFGGIKGAVGAAASDAVTEVEGAADVLPRLFRALVTVNAEQKPTRRRAARAELESDPVLAALVQRLVGDQGHARLLVTQEAHVEVAHEILFDAWQAMADWIAEFKHDLQLRDRMSFEARQWDASGRSDPHLLWSHERQQPLYESLRRLGQPLPTWTEEPEHSFLRPEAERLLDEIADRATTHQRRDWIGTRWAAIGDPRRGVGVDPETGLPDIVWSDEIPSGRIVLEDDAGRFKIDRPFRIAVHLLTRDQYVAFLEASDGYDHDVWWDGLAKPDSRWPPTGAGGNYPVGLVTWNEAVAYCRWLDDRLRRRGDIGAGQKIRLPTEWEWQLAATGGDLRREFPWVGPFDAGKLNSVESGLMRTTAVGLFPAGAANCGALDMAGNIWEWCLNKYRHANDTGVGGPDERVVRGGSWVDYQSGCRAAYRFRYDPDSRFNLIGFRLCLSSPIEGY